MTELWLVRHGQTDWNLAGKWQGQSPQAPGLNDTGRAQAIAVRQQLRFIKFDAIYSSDLLRARQTAELVAEPLRLSITLEPRLREMNLGAWEGMLASEIEAQYPLELAERTRNPPTERAPGGESPREVAARVLRAVNEIVRRHHAASILIVSHGISLAVMICHANGLLLKDVYQHIPENTQPVHITKWLPALPSTLLV
ncbi:MAG: alpha-ribazole phosphatase [Anaerolineae bacterium CG_4_9_14_3_um_filter_57_17]|nr:histidine phosphatase family protein [bacterium]NCT21919.1 histidine phosphatase family protein [bacterium]OIO84676.1 MAG: hypothetical protein AUK01_08735 [Anaerolineae bacterium CG2_30_57_67]PJB65959.1 MAG: alpha-ribazole phosphatase [Anaerolineae bacterium CG_4_9_14_3_um_filter_57_17]